MDPLPDQPAPGRPVPRRPAPNGVGPTRPFPRRRAAGPEQGPPPLPRRRPATDAADDREPARDPDGRPVEPVDDAMLYRLLTGLREI